MRALKCSGPRKSNELGGKVANCSCMSHHLEASLGSLIVLIAFGTLFDMQQGRLSEAGHRVSDILAWPR